MGKKIKGGRRSPSDRGLLLLRINSCNLDINTLSVDQIVEHLRSNFPDYCRIKQQPFTKHVLQTLQHINSKGPYPNTVLKEDDEDLIDNRTESSSSQSPTHKKMRKIDLEEEQLDKIETEFDRRNFNKKSISSQSSLSSDTIFEEPFETEVDLVKTQLPSKYGDSKPVFSGKSDSEKIHEVEMVEKAQKIDSTEVFRDAKRQQDFKGVFDDKVEGPRFRNLGGMKSVVDEMVTKVVVPLKYPWLPLRFRVKPITGILLHGPPGCGKTELAHAIANETGVSFYSISATELVPGISGASKENIGNLFAKAYKTAPSIIFIDEIEAIASKRENLQRETDRRIVIELMDCMGKINRNLRTICTKTNSVPLEQAYVLVIGATNNPDAIDPALRRPGRFDREIELGIPDEDAREEILSILTDERSLEGAFDLKKIARLTPGFVGADLVALADMAGELGMNRITEVWKKDFSSASKNKKSNDEWWKQRRNPKDTEMYSITMTDFEEAVNLVQPSLRRKGFSSIPNVKWDDLGGLNLLREEFHWNIVKCMKHPERLDIFDIKMDNGFLLYGPPGCGKTSIAMAVANEAGANFIHIKGPEIFNKYVGESESKIRSIFGRARSCAPCILFFDEIDALTTERGKDGGPASDRILTQLLVVLDGGESRKGVFVIGATNKLELIDPALLRPGRLGKVLYVPLPNPVDRGLILKAITRKKPIAANVDLESIGRSDACNNLSGADLAELVKEASMAAFKETFTYKGVSTTESWTIKSSHFQNALKKISPSVTKEVCASMNDIWIN